MRTMTISSTTDIRTYINNANPANILGEGNGAVERAVEGIRTAEGRPAWGEDWSEWLEANAERIALEAA